MSAISSRVANALYTKLNVSGVTNLATGGVFFETANGNLPYVVFHRQAPGRPLRAFGNTLLAEDDLWLIKAYSDENSSATKSPQALNDEILAACETAIGDSLTLAAGQTKEVSRFSDILLPAEQRESDAPVYGAGFLLKVFATPS